MFNYESIIPNHNMKLIDPYYDLVRTGKKIYEVRINDEKRQKFQIGDFINIQYREKYDNNSIKPDYIVQVTEKNLFNTFREAIVDSGIENVLPNAFNLEEGIRLYETLSHRDGTYQEAALKYGVVRFKFKLV